MPKIAPLFVIGLLLISCAGPVPPLRPSTSTSTATPIAPTTPANIASSKLYREDGAFKVDLAASGSLQNPAWSPDSDMLLFTRFSNGYNQEPADLLIIDLVSNAVRTLVSDGSGNINLPGSSWQPLTEQIVFSSSREPHDEIFVAARGIKQMSPFRRMGSGLSTAQTSRGLNSPICLFCPSLAARPPG